MLKSKSLQKKSEVKCLIRQDYVTFNYYNLMDATLEISEKRPIGEFCIKKLFLDGFLMKRNAENKSFNLYVNMQKIFLLK